MRSRGVRPLFAGAALLFFAAGRSEAHHWDWAYADQGHAMPVERLDGAQPLISPPPNPDVGSKTCFLQDAIGGEQQFQDDCLPNFTAKMARIPDPLARHSKASCCLQYEIGPRQVALGKQPWRGYQLTFGPYFMSSGVNDEFTIGYAEVPNGANLNADSAAAGEAQNYEYMVAFEFWQYKGSHHFIMDDLLGPYNDPAHPRNCTPGSECEKFANLSATCPAATQYDANENPVSGPRTNPKNPGDCDAPSGMQGFPTAGSPGPSYFPVPYPDGVGIKISRDHIFRMTHHLQHWFDPQHAQVWINVYTVPAKRHAGESFVENVNKEAHVFFDGSASGFLIPPHTIGRAQGVWVAPRNIELYGLTFHSHKRDLVGFADLVGTNGEVKDLPARTYHYSHPYCGGFAGCSQNDLSTCDLRRESLPMHLFESTDWSDHEQCPYWREDVDADGKSDNDTEGALIIKQGEGIRYECWVNNGVLPLQALVGADRIDPQDAEEQGRLPHHTLAAQPVPLQPHDAFGRIVRGKFSCEEIPGVIPGFPGAGALGYYGNRPCLPDVLKGKDPSTDLTTPDGAAAVAAGGVAAECRKDDTWTQFRQPWFSGNYTGNCVPASIGFAETEDDEMCILLGLYAFTDDDLVKGGPKRLPTDVGR